MSFIEENPLQSAGFDSFPPTPPEGKRGLFPKEDGWYDIDSDGNKHRLANVEDIKKGEGGSTIPKWQPNKEYNVGDIVSYYFDNGTQGFEEPVEVLAVCTGAHASSTTDEIFNGGNWTLISVFNAVFSHFSGASNGLIIGENTISGEELVEFVAETAESIIQEWQPNKEYNVGDKAIRHFTAGETGFENDCVLILMCYEKHISGEEFNGEYWNDIPIGLATASNFLLTSDGAISGDDIPDFKWRPNTEYKVGDVVKFVYLPNPEEEEVTGEKVPYPVEVMFVCKEEHISGDTYENDISSDKWEELWSRASMSSLYLTTSVGGTISGDKVKEAIDQIGDIESALDSIIAIQNKLMGVSE